MKATRVFQITALLLILVSVATVGWWAIDLRTFVGTVTTDAKAQYANEVTAAQALLDAGTPAAKVRELLPRVEIEGSTARASRNVIDAYDAEFEKRKAQYEWESAFFLLALGVCIAVISRALRAEARVLQEQDHFLALVSHQFKTPLASLQLSLETMAMRSLSPTEQRPLIDRMLADLARMETLVTRILDSVRLERGRVDFKRQPMDLSTAVARVVGQLEARSREQRITIAADVPRGLEVFADPMAVDVVIRNLLENALAAVAPVGGGTITLTAQRVGGEIELSIRDTGVGFRPSDSIELFKKFSRLHPGGGSSYQGTGLGLFIVRRMMQLEGGRVSAHSDGVGQGAQFVLTWPIAPAETP
ncbi:MAG TPA: HAMP domain-containing sensor histidine kinase [Steroidobacteraceae bacterium]